MQRTPQAVKDGVLIDRVQSASWDTDLAAAKQCFKIEEALWHGVNIDGEGQPIEDPHCSSAFAEHLSNMKSLQDAAHIKGRTEKATGTFKQSMSGDDLNDVDVYIVRFTDYVPGAAENWLDKMMDAQFFKTATCMSIAIGNRGHNVIINDFSDYFFLPTDFDQGMGHFKHFEIAGIELSETKRKTKKTIRRGFICSFDVRRCSIMQIFNWIVGRFCIRQDPPIPGHVGRPAKEWMHDKMFPRNGGNGSEPMAEKTVRAIYTAVLSGSGTKRQGLCTHFTRRLAEQFANANEVDASRINFHLQHGKTTEDDYKVEVDPSVMLALCGWGDGFQFGIDVPSLLARKDLEDEGQDFIGLVDHIFKKITGIDGVLPYLSTPSTGTTEKGNTEANTLSFVANVILIGICRLREQSAVQPNHYILKHPSSPFSTANESGKWRTLYDKLVNKNAEAIGLAEQQRTERIEQHFAKKGFPSTGGGGGGGGAAAASATVHGSNAIRQLQEGQETIRKGQEEMHEALRSITPEAAVAVATAATTAAAAATAAATATAAAAATTAAAAATSKSATTAPEIVKSATVRRKRKKEGGVEAFKEPAFSISSVTLAKTKSVERWLHMFNVHTFTSSSGESRTLEAWESKSGGNGGWRIGAAEKVRKQVERVHAIADYIAFVVSESTGVVLTDKSVAQLLDTEFGEGKEALTLGQFMAKKMDECKECSGYASFIKGRLAMKPNERVIQKRRKKSTDSAAEGGGPG